MTLEELIEAMKRVNTQHGWDHEVCHMEIDKLLLEYIGSDKVKRLYEADSKWYA